MSERGIQANTGASEQEAARNAALASLTARLQNYGQERQYQQNAGSQAEQAYAPLLNYLGAIPNASLGGLQQIAQILQGLAGGGQIATPNSTIVRQPGAWDYTLQGLNTVAKFAGGK